MAKLRHWIGRAFLVSVLAAPMWALAQGHPAAPAPQTAAPAPQKAADGKSAAAQDAKAAPRDENAFPEDVSRRAAGESTAQNTPKQEAPKENTAKPAAPADENAFPEDVSKRAEEAAHAEEKADRTAAASGSVAGGAADDHSSSSREGFKDLDVLGDHDSRISNGAGGVVVNTELSDDDVRIGSFYLDTGDYQGAYDRFKEAVAVNPDNSEAVFRLAEAAQKLRRRDEAIENYTIYLAAVPDGPHAKVIRKALAELGKK